MGDDYLGRSFAFERGGPKRLQLIWKPGYRDFEVLFDGAFLSGLPVGRSLELGFDLPLPDGSWLWIQHKRKGFTAQGWHVTRGGVPLPGSAADPSRRIKDAAYLLYFMALLQAARCLVMFGMPQLFAPVHIDVSAATGNLISALLYVVFGYFTSRRWRLALAIPVLESGYSMITVSLRSGSQLVFLAVMLLSITVAKVLIHGFIAIGEEARTARLPSLTAESRTRAA